MRPLDMVVDAISGAGYNISTAFEDLVFVEHSEFLVKFSDRPMELILYTNKAMSDAEQRIVLKRVQLNASGHGIKIVDGGCFALEKKDNSPETLVHFYTSEELKA